MRLRLTRSDELEPTNTTTPRWPVFGVTRLFQEEAVRRELHKAETAEDVHVEDELELRIRRLQACALTEAEVRRVRDDDIEPPGLLLDDVHHRRDVRASRDVARQRAEAGESTRLQRPHALRNGGVVRPAEEDLRPLAEKPVDDLQPRVPAPTGHDHNLVHVPCLQVPDNHHSDTFPQRSTLRTAYTPFAPFTSSRVATVEAICSPSR